MKKPSWISKLEPYAKSGPWKSFFYTITTFIPYFAILSVMFILQVKGYPYWLILLLALAATGFFTRIFIILHDCCHGSFVKTSRKNNILGHISGFFTFTPFFDWQKNHAIHHATVANLDKRGIGDVWTMTFDEYKDASVAKRRFYRFFRNPFFLFVLAPVFLFVVMYRLPQKSTGKKGVFSILITNIVLAGFIIAAYFTVGIKNYIAVQLPIAVLGTSTGMWLFYVQHQFKNVYWAHKEDWDINKAAMNGSSFYKLPWPLPWFSGNIGYHNIHHLKPRIPSYNLKKCYDEIPELHYIIPITLLSGFKSMRLHVWDEETKKLISFRDANKKVKSENK